MTLIAHKRCLYRVTQEKALERVGPTGHRNGSYGIWQVRQCVYCGTVSARWKPGIHTTSHLDALDMNRPANEAELHRLIRRDLRLLEIERKYGVNKASFGESSLDITIKGAQVVALTGAGLEA